MALWENLLDQLFFRFVMRPHLELADLGVKGEGVEEHGTDESYVGRLAGGGF